MHARNERERADPFGSGRRRAAARSRPRRSVLLLGAVGIMALAGWGEVERLESGQRRETAMLGEQMVKSLQSLMLSGDALAARDWLARLNEQPETLHATVLRRDGGVAFRDLETLRRVNAHLGEARFAREPLPEKIASVPAGAVARAAAGERVWLEGEETPEAKVTLLLPVGSGPRCLACHGYEDHPVRGVLALTRHTPMAAGQLHRDPIFLAFFVPALLLGAMAWRGRRPPGGREHRETRLVTGIASAMEGMLFVVDADGRIAMANRTAAERMGGTPEVLAGRAFADLFVEEAPLPPAEVERLRREGRTARVTRTLRLAGDATAPVLVTATRLEETPGAPESTVYTLLDPERRSASDRGLEVASRALETTTNAVVICDSRGRVEAVNPAFCAATGFSREEVTGRGVRHLRSSHHPPDFYRRMWRQVRDLGFWEGEVWGRRKSGEPFPEWVSITPLRDEEGEITHFVSIGSDISEIKASEERLRHMATHDMLTGLPNRVLLLDRLDHALRRAERERRRIALLCVDLNDFKTVNDTCGHQAGDRALATAAQRLRRSVRRSDTVARVGGDEFCVILEPIRATGDVRRICEKIVAALDVPLECDCDHLTLGASIGAGLYPDHGTDVDALLRRADDAMYAAKRARCGYRFAPDDECSAVRSQA